MLKKSQNQIIYSIYIKYVLAKKSRKKEIFQCKSSIRLSNIKKKLYCQVDVNNSTFQTFAYIKYILNWYLKQKRQITINSKVAIAKLYVNLIYI